MHAGRQEMYGSTVKGNDASGKDPDCLEARWPVLRK
jgi:hypothetical protein